MATSNFTRICADKYYVLSDDNRERDEVEEVLNDLTYELIDDGFNRNRKWAGRSGMVLAERYSGGENLDLFASLTTQFIVMPGYYADATLDYDVKVCICCGDEFSLSDHDGSVDGLVEELMEEVRLVLAEEKEWGLYRIGKVHDHIKGWLKDLIEGEKKRMEAFCASHCDQTLRLVGRFSNGETIYEEA